MEPHVAIAKGAHGNPVHLDIGNEQDLGIQLPDAFRALAQGLGRLFARAQRAKAGGEAQLVFLGQILPAHAEHEMLVPSLLDLGHDFVRKFFLEIDAPDLGPASLAQRNDFHIIGVKHARSPAGWPQRAALGSAALKEPKV